MDKEGCGKDLVNLLTTNLSTGEKKLTEGFERGMLEKWINRVRSESSEGVLEFEIKEKI